MKKRIGKLNGKSIVIGHENEITKKEIHYHIVAGLVVLKVRKDDGKLHAITVNETADNPSTTPPEDEETQVISDNTETSNSILDN